MGGVETAVREEVVSTTPFSSLIHFAKEPATSPAARCSWSPPWPDTSPRCCAAPCARLLADHDVYVTDWHNARDVPSSTAASVSTTTSAN